MAICPECEYDDLEVDDLEEGEELACPECGQRLVLAGPDDVRAVDDEDDLDDELEIDDDEEDDHD